MRLRSASLLYVLWLGLSATTAQAEARKPDAPLASVVESGVRVWLPADFVSEPRLEARESDVAARVHAFTDHAREPVNLWVVRAPNRAGADMPGLRDREAAARGYARAFAETLPRAVRGASVQDLTASEYDAPRRAFRLSFSERSQSRARALLDAPATDASWDELRAAGLDEGIARCYLSELLDGAPSKVGASLLRRVEETAASCGVSRGNVLAFAVDVVGPAFFAPAVTQFHTLSFFTRSSLVLVLISAPASRTNDARSLAEQVWMRAEVDVEAPPTAVGAGRGASPHAASPELVESLFMAGRALGALLGAFFGALVLGRLLGLYMRKAGVPVTQRLRLMFGGLVALSGLGALVALHAGSSLEPATFAPWLAYAALGLGTRARGRVRRWLLGERVRGAQPLALDQRGLSLLEYAVLFIILVVGALGLWRALGDSLEKQVHAGGDRVDSALAAALAADADRVPGLTEPRNAAAGPGDASQSRGHTGSAAPSGTPAPTADAARNAAASSPSAASVTPGARDASSPPSAAAAAGAGTPDTGSGVLGAIGSFAAEHPVATEVTKQVGLMLAETFIPGVSAITSVHTLMDPEAAGWEKGLAAVELATTLLPVAGAAAKAAGKAVHVAVDAYKDGKRVARAAEGAAEVAAREAGKVDDVAEGLGALVGGRKGKAAHELEDSVADSLRRDVANDNAGKLADRASQVPDHVEHVDFAQRAAKAGDETALQRAAGDGLAHGSAPEGARAQGWFSKGPPKVVEGSASSNVAPKNAGRKIPNSELKAPPAKRGHAPIGEDGHPVELHHRNQEPTGPIDEMTRTEHRGGENFKKNHSNTGQTPSKIDRSAWKKEQKGYWKKEWDDGRFNDDE